MTQKNLNRAADIVESAQCYAETVKKNKYINKVDDLQQKENDQLVVEKIIHLLSESKEPIRDPKTYFELIKKNAENGNEKNMGILAVLYYFGYGVEYSEVKAKAILRYTITTHPKTKEGLIASFFSSKYIDSQDGLLYFQEGFLYDSMVRDGFSQALNKWVDIPAFQQPSCV